MAKLATQARRAIEARPVLAFTCLTYAVTWGIWWPIALDIVPAGPIESVGVFAPTLVGLALTSVLAGTGGLRQLGAKLVDWRAGPRWYLLTLAFSPVLLLVAVGVARLFEVTVPLSRPAPELLVVGFLYVLVTSVAGEELGWRGFALPRLQRSYTALTASLLLGVAWFLWHLPLFYMADDFHRFVPIELFALQTVGFTVLYTWLFNNTDGSLLFPHLFHTVNNFSFFLIPVLPMGAGDPTAPLWVGIGLLWGAVIVVVVLAGPADLSGGSGRVTYDDRLP